MRIDIITLFPEMFAGPFAASILARAQRNGLAEIHLHDFRRHGLGRHRMVDDTPYGGGGGMLLRPEPIFAAVDEIQNSAESKPFIILLTPQGEPLKHHHAVTLAEKNHLLVICGHYEGFDERIRTGLADQEISIGDFVLTGGELPAMVLVDAVVRQMPDVLGAEDGAADDSFAQGLLDYPQYTKPAEFRGCGVPDVLLSGNHARISAWRRKQALLRTAARRPDLLQSLDLTAKERAFLKDNGFKQSLPLGKEEKDDESD